MSSSDLQRVESLFHKARLLEPADRAAFLDRECAGELSLRSEVESLLAFSDRSTGDVSVRPPAPSTPTVIERGPLHEGPGSRIGPYRLLQQIGEGGFGVVYMAEQEHPVRRKVAIKVIKLGMDTRQVIARFEAERQALALMDHPNIARVLDAGATETGRPYFVMELVRGIPLTEFCDTRNLAARERLALFIDVCQGVQHAHQKGIIHRDIKPTNVLVTLHDDRPVPKIIDFGIAKATSHRLTERTLFTEFRQMVGTPEYMSPDQADISGLDVDTRTDIYSLGALLYELLTGTTPFDPETLRTGGYAEIQRIIREVQPPVPSTRVTMMERQLDRGSRASAPVPADPTATSSGHSLKEIARRRRTEPADLRRLLRGELDWIVMKAMEKDRTRRYQTAAEFSADLRRHLSNEPVLAGPPSAVYRLRKFLQRHRLGAAVALVIAGALVLGAALATVGFVRARREAAHSQAVSAFLQGLITQLDQAHDQGHGTDEIVQRGRALLGDDHALVASLLTTRASALRGAGRMEPAIEAQREALRLYRTVSPGDSPAVAATLSGLGALLAEERTLGEAERVLRDALEMKRRLTGPRSRQTADALLALTKLLHDSGDISRQEEVAQLWHETVDAYRAAMGPDDRTTVTQMCEYGTWLHNVGRSEQASVVLNEAVERARTVLGPDDLTRFMAINALAQYLLFQTGDTSEAIVLCDELLQISRAVWGRGHISGLSLLLQLASLNYKQTKVVAAERAVREFVEDRRAVGPVANSIILMLEQQAWLGMREWMGDNPEVGRDFLMLVVEDARAALAPQTPERQVIIDRVAVWLADHGFHAEAEPLLRESLELLDLQEEPATAARARTLHWLGVALVGLDRAEEAEPRLRACLEIDRSDLGADEWLLPSAKSALGECLTMLGRFDEAEPLLLNAHAALLSNLLAPPPRRRDAERRLARLYREWGRPDDAARWEAEPARP